MPTSTRATSNGFTLVELSLVLLILGVLLSLSVPRLLELGQAHLESSASRMANMISYLHDEASLRGRIYRLTLDLDRDSYTIEVRAPYARGAQAGELVAAWDPYAEPARLPEGVALTSVETASSIPTPCAPRRSRS